MMDLQTLNLNFLVTRLKNVNLNFTFFKKINLLFFFFLHGLVIHKWFLSLDLYLER